MPLGRLNRERRGCRPWIAFAQLHTGGAQEDADPPVKGLWGRRESRRGAVGLLGDEGGPDSNWEPDWDGLVEVEEDWEDDSAEVRLTALTRQWE